MNLVVSLKIHFSLEGGPFMKVTCLEKCSVITVIQTNKLLIHRTRGCIQYFSSTRRTE